MEQYDYLQNEIDDVKRYIEENNLIAEYEDKDELKEHLNDVLFVEDGITGNASGSYTFSTWKAEENICHNIELLGAACEEFGSTDVLKNGAEACDVTIRCYLLPQAVDEAVDEMWVEKDNEMEE